MSSMVPARRITSQKPIPLDYLAETIPTIANAYAFADRSASFKPVTTIDVLSALNREGFEVFDARSMALRSRLERDGYQKHMVRMRHADHGQTRDYVPELIMLNANDGTSSWQLILGAFRFVCENGIIIGTTFGSARVSHTGDNIANRVATAAYGVLANAERLHNVIDTWRGITLDNDAQMAFATEAHAIRFETPDNAPVSPQTMLTVRRNADAGDDLWSVFNRVQENTTRGGFTGRITNAKGKPRKATMRPINGIASTIDVNRALFDLGERYAAIAA